MFYMREWSVIMVTCFNGENSGFRRRVLDVLYTDLYLYGDVPKYSTPLTHTLI